MESRVAVWSCCFLGVADLNPEPGQRRTGSTPHVLQPEDTEFVREIVADDLSGVIGSF